MKDCLTEIKKYVGYIAEEPILYKSLTPRELFEFVASIRGLDAKKTTNSAHDYMESLEALDYYNKVIATLSRGNKQKVQLVSALLHDPKVMGG